MDLDLYTGGDVVWVKMGNCWWPGEVCSESQMPQGLLASMKGRPPIAVVRFFQEKTFEYVKNLNNIYKYNCAKKKEFIKKGLDMYRSKKQHMEKFPADVQLAENMTGGDPNIIESEEFAPEVRKKWSDLFEDTSAKKAKGKVGRTPMKSKTSPIVDTPRPITHPRFIRKAIDGTTDHEVRILAQPSTSCTTPVARGGQRNSFSGGGNAPSYSSPGPQNYKCHLCNFSSARLNVVILHSKSHSNEPPPQQKGKRMPAAVTTPKVKAASKVATPARGSTTKKQTDTSTESATTTPKPTKSAAAKSPVATPKKTPAKKSTAKQRGKRGTPAKVVEKSSEDDSDGHFVVKTAKPAVASPTNSVKPEEKLKSSLLADWSEDESEVLGFEADITKNVQIINKSAKSSPGTSATSSAVKEPLRIGKELSDLQDAISKSIESTDTHEEGRNNKDVVTDSAPVMKYRNIPKKSRYLFSQNLDEVADVPAVKKEEPVDNKKEAESVDAPDAVKAISTKERILSRASRRRTESAKQSGVLAEAEELPGDAKVAEVSVESKFEDKNDTVEPELPIVVEHEPVKEEPTPEEVKPAIEISKEEEKEEAEAPKPAEDEAIDGQKDEKLSPKRETSCFDFAEDDEEMPLKSPPTRRRSRKSIPLVETPTKAEDPPKDEVEDSVEAATDAKKLGDEKSVDNGETPNEANSVTLAEKEKEKEDEALQNEIASLLKETEVPQIDVLGNNDVSSTSIDIKERKLPPKERGKRIFKSRNNKNDTSAATSSSTAATIDPSKDDPSVNDKEDEPQAANKQESPEKDASSEVTICQLSTTPTEADLQVAEALIALPQIRDNRAEVATERRTSSRRESKRQQLADAAAAAAAVESQKRRDIEEKVEAAEFLVGLSMSTGTSPLTESVVQNVVEKMAPLDEPSTPVASKRAQRKRQLKTDERLTPELSRTRAKKTKLDDDDDEVVAPSPPIVEKKTRGRKRVDDGDWSPDAGASKPNKRRHYDTTVVTTKNHLQQKPVEEMVDVEDEIPVPFVIEKAAAASPVQTSPVTTTSSPKGSSKRKSKREQTTKLPIVEPTPAAIEPTKKDDTIFDITNMPIVLSDEPIVSVPISVGDNAPSTSNKPCDANLIVISSPDKVVVAVDAATTKDTNIRNSISPTNNKPSLKTIKLKAADTQKIKELQQKSSLQASITSPTPTIGVGDVPAKPKPSLIKSQIILPPVVGSPGSPGAIAANAALLSRSSISSPSASEDETQMHVSTKRFPKGKKGNLVQEEIKLTPTNPVVLPKSPLVKGSGNSSGSVGGQLIITSKGTLITTQSLPVTSMGSYTSSDGATTLVGSTATTVVSHSSTTITSPVKHTLKSKKPPKPIAEPQLYPSSKTAVAANASKIMQQKSQAIEQTMAPVTGPRVNDKTLPSPKREVVRMSAQKLAEMTRLGYIEEKPHGKVLTPSGVRRMQEQKLLGDKRVVNTTIAAATPSPTTAVVSPPLSSPGVIVVDSKIGQSSPLTVATTTIIASSSSTNDHLEVLSSPTTIINDKKTAEPCLQSPMLASCSSDVDDVDKTSCDSVIEEDVASTSNLANTDDTQIAAIPAENFGGPPNAFYLCSVGEDGSLKPMKDKIYILDGVTSRLIAVDNVDESAQDAVGEVLTVHGDEPDVGMVQQPDDVIEIPGEDAEEPAIVAGDPENPSILINIGDQQIVLDQQTLLSLASGGEMPQLLNQDGQPLLLQDYAQEILEALAMNQAQAGSVNISDDGAEQQIILADDITGVGDNQVLATREQLLVTVGGLENLVVENQSPNLIDIIDPSINFQSMNAQAHTSETSATQGVIMSTIEAPTSTKTNGITTPTSSSSSSTSPSLPIKISSNLDESLAQVLGPIASNPIQLELPITITNPDIAPKVAKNFNPLQIYPNSVLPIGLVSTTTTTVASPFDPTEPTVAALSMGDSMAAAEEKENSSSASNNNNYNDPDDEIISGSPSPMALAQVRGDGGGSGGGHDDDDESTNSSEIPIQPNLVFREHLILNDAAAGDDEFSDAEPANDTNFNLNGNNNSNLIGNSR